jgi:RNA polymerase sigma-70 factor, ECF subfamily
MALTNLPRSPNFFRKQPLDLMLNGSNSERGAIAQSVRAQSVRAELLAVMPRLLRFARVLCRPPLDAEDLLQMTCERALSRHAQFLAGTRFDHWSFSIMHSIWKNELRRLGTERKASDAMPPLAHDDGERQVIGKIWLSDVLSALKRLPEDQAAAMTLVNIDGLSYAQAADVLGIPQGTLESRIARGRVALGRLLEEGGHAQSRRGGARDR